MSKPFVYVASPYTKGDPAINTRFQMQIFGDLLSSGLVNPYVPLWSHFQHLVDPRPYEEWLQYDLDIIERMDACIRLNARGPNDYLQCESAGADKEVERFKQQGKPVFYTMEDLFWWARDPELYKVCTEHSAMHTLACRCRKEGRKLKYGPHWNENGFFVGADNGDWPDCGHGHTLNEAALQMLKILDGTPFCRYIPEDFGMGT
jgi:hypothetical protein